jgi:hypothetical protein
MREMARLRDLAAENNQFAAAINAEYRRGQAVGLYVDRKEVVTGSLDKMSRPELEAKLKELREGLIVNGEYSVLDDGFGTSEEEPKNLVRIETKFEETIDDA